MNDLTLTELATLLSVFNRAGLSDLDKTEQEMFERIQHAHAERLELESMDFDDCLGGACKL
ncbi:hypothetical protein [Neptunomonas antarctica]|uniref:Uncharacterized protein n=1 Tax=Neptunomonas antarctica TaxID=619304 RepID=A0A1N7J6W2_9GAMM|nr:hypothetical protein [Neptunomonas antarctica]SIS45103.1 hypothetical protein SAMN05421760_101702 [Neptunomonas antarctica]